MPILRFYSAITARRSPSSNLGEAVSAIPFPITSIFSSELRHICFLRFFSRWHWLYFRLRHPQANRIHPIMDILSLPWFISNHLWRIVKIFTKNNQKIFFLANQVKVLPQRDWKTKECACWHGWHDKQGGRKLNIDIFFPPLMYNPYCITSGRESMVKRSLRIGI